RTIRRRRSSKSSKNVILSLRYSEGSTQPDSSARSFGLLRMTFSAFYNLLETTPQSIPHLPQIRPLGGLRRPVFLRLLRGALERYGKAHQQRRHQRQISPWE